MSDEEPWAKRVDRDLADLERRRKVKEGGFGDGIKVNIAGIFRFLRRKKKGAKKPPEG